MVEPRGQARLADETLLKGRIVAQLGRQELEGDGTLEHEVAGAVDDAHAAVPDHLLEPVRGKLLADLRDPGAGHRASLTGASGECHDWAACSTSKSRGPSRAPLQEGSFPRLCHLGASPRLVPAPVLGRLRNSTRSGMTTPAPRGAPELGSEIAGYRLESVLGEGGMGTVYLARDREGGLCAVKVLSTAARRRRPELRHAVQAGGRSTRRPSITRTCSSCTRPARRPTALLFFAMQYVDGPDLGVLAAARRRAEPGAGPRDPRADRRCARLRARERPRAPRREAGQHHRGRRPRRPACVSDRFRAEQEPGDGLVRADADGPADRHAGLHRAGGDPRHRSARPRSSTSTRSAASCTRRSRARRHSSASATSPCSTRMSATSPQSDGGPHRSARRDR